MLSRRRFIATSSASIAAPFVLTKGARAQTLRVRRDVTGIPDNDPFFEKYADAVRRMHELPNSDPRNWRNQATTHADYCPHGKPDFLHWHRHYITFFERICGELIGDSDFALPYWNWSRNRGRIPAPFFDLDALNVEYWKDPSNYNGKMWVKKIQTLPRRGLTRNRGLLDDPVRNGSFRQADIDKIKRQPTFTRFQTDLEGSPHNNVHRLTGALPSGRKGHMGGGLSPLDPIFWLHHCMVDRIWAEWQTAANITLDPRRRYNDQFVNATGSAVSVTAAGSLDFASLGFTYDVIENNQTGSIFRSLTANERVELAARFPVSESNLLGVAKNVKISTIDRATSIKVNVKSLADELQSERQFRPMTFLNNPRTGTEQRRILARFTEVSTPRGEGDFIVNVFVNYPDLTPSATTENAHFGGSFSFFGGAMANNRGYKFLIDITDPLWIQLKEFGKLPDEVNVQLMPVAAAKGGAKTAKFTVGNVEIISV